MVYFLYKFFGAAFLPVCDSSRPLGLLPDRDITVRITDQGVIRSRLIAVDVMSPDQDIIEAAQRMAAHQIRAFRSLKSDQQLVGTACHRNLAAQSRHKRLAGDVCRGPRAL
jgi:CBS-domain-containing membrane protein